MRPSMEIGSAFSAPFKDAEWGMKFLVGSVMVFCCLFGFGFFVLAGYYIETTRRSMKDEPIVLPEWKDLGVKFITGFKFVMTLFLYVLPLILLAIPLIVLLAFSIANDPEAGPGFLASIYLFGYVLLAIPYGLMLTLTGPIIAYKFAEREKISDGLNVGEVLRLFKANWESTIVVALLVIGIKSLAGIGIIALIVGVLFTMFYVYLVAAILNGQLYRHHHWQEELQG
jgi:hypothetical protein